MNHLNGRKIIGVRMSANKTTLSFDTDNGTVCYVAEGDCCSESWFNHVSGLLFLIGSTIERVETLTTRGAPGTRQEEDTVYGWQIQSNRGTCAIEMRNSSNGCYGGSVQLDMSANGAATIPLTDDF